ncbi:MAG TPA: hypothetical protein V6D48_24120 [Oculatellaceae cyanobacterium]
MPSLDESEWISIHAQIHLKKDPWEEMPVALDFPADKIIVSVNQIAANLNWHKAGWLRQRWNRLVSSARVTRHYLPLNESIVLTIEPVSSSILWISTVTWLPEFQLQIEARRYQPNPELSDRTLNLEIVEEPE